MAVGLRVRSAVGGITLRHTDRLSRHAGYVETGTSNGSFTIPVSVLGTLYFTCITDSYRGLGVVGAAVRLDGRVISWTFNNTLSTRLSTVIAYGAF